MLTVNMTSTRPSLETLMSSSSPASSIDPAHQSRHPIEGTPARKRVAVGTSVGATIETYDFIGFGTAAALYFNTVFFPSSDPLSGTLLSFATLGIGLAVQPLGALIGGYLGDQIGRPPGAGRVPLLLGV